MEMSLAAEAQTERLGGALAMACLPGTVIHLRGDLGAGKTTLARGFLRALGYSGAVKSPTYTLVESYALSAMTVYHLDLYRLSVPREVADIGVRDYFDGHATCLVEWPERGGGELPEADVEVSLRYHGQGRLARIAAFSEKGRSVTQSFAATNNQE